MKALEEKGIGRPSTYAPTMSTIQDRGYVDKDGRALKPTDLGEVVNDLLVEHFPDFVDIGFTATMEDELDDVASGDREWQPVVREMYEPLEKPRWKRPQSRRRSRSKRRTSSAPSAARRW